jgi:hypothetical protein
MGVRGPWSARCVADGIAVGIDSHLLNAHPEPVTSMKAFKSTRDDDDDDDDDDDARKCHACAWPS